MRGGWGSIISYHVARPVPVFGADGAGEGEVEEEEEEEWLGEYYGSCEEEFVVARFFLRCDRGCLIVKFWDHGAGWFGWLVGWLVSR